MFLLTLLIPVNTMYGNFRMFLFSLFNAKGSSSIATHLIIQ